MMLKIKIQKNNMKKIKIILLVILLLVVGSASFFYIDRDLAKRSDAYKSTPIEIEKIKPIGKLFVLRCIVDDFIEDQFNAIVR